MYQEIHYVFKEEWDRRAIKKACWFRQTQKSYLLAKFCNGQTTFHKLDAEGVAREMWRSHGVSGVRLLDTRAKRLRMRKIFIFNN